VGKASGFDSIVNGVIGNKFCLGKNPAREEK